jgi:hypothetical protein
MIQLLKRILPFLKDLRILIYKDLLRINIYRLLNSYQCMHNLICPSSMYLNRMTSFLKNFAFLLFLLLLLFGLEFCFQMNLHKSYLCLCNHSSAMFTLALNFSVHHTHLA